MQPKCTSQIKMQTISIKEVCITQNDYSKYHHENVTQKNNSFVHTSLPRIVSSIQISFETYLGYRRNMLAITIIENHY